MHFLFKKLFILITSLSYVHSNEMDVGFMRGVLKSHSVTEYYEREIRKLDRHISKFPTSNFMFEWMEFKAKHLLSPRVSELSFLKHRNNNLSKECLEEIELQITYEYKREFLRKMKNGDRAFPTEHSFFTWLIGNRRCKDD